MKMLVAMQFWEGDKKRAMEVARFIADIEPNFREDVEFCFAARFDATHDKSAIQFVNQKFPVRIFTSKRTGTGWPDGCNDLWHELMIWAYMMKRDKHADWDCVLTIESDSCPLQSNWLDLLKAEWKKAKAENPNMVACGCRLHRGTKDDHINGNAMWDTAICVKVDQFYGTPRAQSWDTFHAHKFMDRSYDTPLIRSEHNLEKRGPATEEKIFDHKNGVIPALFHGVKSNAAEIMARKRMKMEYEKQIQNQVAHKATEKRICPCCNQPIP